MKKKHKFRNIAITLVLVSAVGVLTVPRVIAGNAPPVVSHTEIYPDDLVNSVNIKGTVESVEKRNVYTTLGFPIKNVNVEVGDRVEEGQVLCVLDTDDLELNIIQQKIDLEVTSQSGDNTLQNNRRIYNEAYNNLQNGTNAQVLSAENSLKTAELNLANAQKNYDDALKDLNEGTNSQVMSAESALVNAELDLKTKTDTYEKNKALFDVGAISKDAFSQSEDLYTSALNKYNDAAANLETALTSQNRNIEQLESALNSARTSYENAQASLNTSRISAQQELEKYQNSISSAQISSNTEYKEIAIQKLEKQLVDSVIKAPVSGTVSAVYAKEGANGSGLLFVIEDTENLKITTRIKEYDAGRITPGMDVVIKSDATGSNTYEGKLSKISPVAVKNAAGDTQSTSDVEFVSEVTVLSKDTGLRIGMNARLNIILEKKDNVYRVPYDSVVTDSNGSSVYIVDYNESSEPIVKQVPVNTGMETDFYVEIIGDLSDGMKVINDASSVSPGMKITLN